MARTKTKKKKLQFIEDRKRVSVLLFILSCLLYLNTLNHDYALDDAIVIHKNIFTTNGFSGIPDLLSNDSFYGFFQERGKSQLVSGGRYRPLTPVMFAIEWGLFGNTPFIGHLINVLLYAFLAVVVYRFFLFLLGKKKHALWASAIAALIFTIHPVHSEVVANIKGRDEICALLFGLLSILIYYRSRLKYKEILAALLMFLALMSKENAIALVALFPIIELVKYKKEILTSLIKPWKIYIATIFFLIIRGLIVGYKFGDVPNELMNNPFIKVVGDQYVHFNLIEKISSIFYALALDLKLLFFPHPLTHDYYPRYIEVVGISNPVVLIGLITSLVGIILCIRWIINRKIEGIGLFIYFVSLLLVSNVLFPVGTHLSERFLFIPSLGFSFIIGLFAIRYIRNKKIILAGIAILILLMGFKTIDRNRVWENNYTLFTNDIKNSPNSAKLNNAVAGELIAEAQELSDVNAKDQKLNEAIGYLNTAISIHPNYKNAHLLLGNAHHYKGMFKEAIPHYQTALNLDDRYDEAIGNLAKTYREMKQFDLAVEWFQKLLGITGDKENINTNLSLIYEEAGMYYSERGNRDRAISYFQKGLDIGGEEAKFYYFIGIAHAQSGDPGKAIGFLETALEFPATPDNKRNIFVALRQLYESVGNREKAVYYETQLNKQTH